ncbi:MAG: YdcH family protein [Rhodospirillaceae bacterium]
MSVDDHVSALKTRHAALEEILEQEATRPHPDQAVIADLKKKKLRIKDEIAQLCAE